MKQALLIGALLIMIAGAGAKMTGQPRGIRNNNPGNIRRNSTKWQGLAAVQNDSAFFQFTAPDYGIRALARLLVNYQDVHGLNTIRGIISRYAPSSENNTTAYIDAVAAHVGASPDAPLDVRAVLPLLIEAIIQHENGSQPYDVAVINNGIRLAGVAV